ncbi:MAG: cytochrome b [Rhodospirillaceae bacterium]
MTASNRYDTVAMILHWLTAAAVLGLLVAGMTMTRLQPGSALQFSLYQLHKSVGITVLALTLIRIGWRLAHRPPVLPETMPGWERRAAAAGHLALYGLLLVLPLTGWAVVSVSPFNIPTVLYGLMPWPHLPGLATLPPADKHAAEAVLKQLHDAGAWTMLGLLAVHVGAAVRHLLWLRDGVMERMLPRWRPTPS